MFLDIDKKTSKWSGSQHNKEKDLGMDALKADLVKKSMISAVINGVINAAISASAFFKHELVPITLDHISNQEVTVFGEGVMLALLLSLILTGVNYMTFSKDLRKANEGASFPHPFWPWGAKLAVRNGITAFGAAMVIAVIWQRFIGTVMVSPLAATLIMFIIAFLLVFYVSMATMEAMLRAQDGIIAGCAYQRSAVDS